MLNIGELENKNITELHDLAKKQEVSGYSQMRKKDLIFAILKKGTEKGGRGIGEIERQIERQAPQVEHKARQEETVSSPNEQEVREYGVLNGYAAAIR